jgi:hypothetical protein
MKDTEAGADGALYQRPTENKMRLASTLAALLAGAAIIATPARAQSMDDKWQFQAILYGFFPSFGGSTAFPASSGGTPIDVSSDKVLDSLKFAFFGTFDARKGRWGMFTDFIYFDVGGSKENTRDFSIGGTTIPASVSANLALDLKAVVWTIAGQYMVASDPSLQAYVLGGARLLDAKVNLGYSFTADVGPFVGPGRSGSSEVSESFWDAIVGIKGRYAFGERREWFLPFYADVGAGQSKLTWQVFGGVGYQFSWGSVLGGWRYLDYDFKSGSQIKSLNASGPMIGVAFNW